MGWTSDTNATHSHPHSHPHNVVQRGGHDSRRCACEQHSDQASPSCALQYFSITLEFRAHQPVMRSSSAAHQLVLCSTLAVLESSGRSNLNAKKRRIAVDEWMKAIKAASLEISKSSFPPLPPLLFLLLNPPPLPPPSPPLSPLNLPFLSVPSSVLPPPSKGSFPSNLYVCSGRTHPARIVLGGMGGEGGWRNNKA